jgi:glycosyltransferase involved in cell wall biosynthesis
MSEADLPLLTIAIPTFNRDGYLALNLSQLKAEFARVQSGEIEILVCDNHSEDNTQAVVAEAIAGGLPIRYVRNRSNNGSDANIAQCFTLARGEYVLIMGDDDLLLDRSLGRLLDLIRPRDVGVVSMRAYGYEVDFRAEFPGARPGGTTVFQDSQLFIEKLGIFSTLLSANILAKHLLPAGIAERHVGTNLVHTYLVYAAITLAKRNIYIDDYVLACKRNNSNQYDFSEVFVERFGSILDELTDAGISPATVSRVERRLLLSYYPFYAWRTRKASRNVGAMAWARFRHRFNHRPAFWLFVAPILRLPRPLALAWGAVAVVLGRGMTGDFARGASYARHYMKRRLSAIQI